MKFGESDGRCVRALGPTSVQRSILYLLLNPPSSTCFRVLFVCTLLGNVAHFFPFHSLHLDLTFWGVPILLTMGPSQGKLTTEVYRREGTRKGEVERGLSVLEQAPLGGS